MASLCYIPKEIISSENSAKLYEKYGLKTSSRPFSVCKELSTTSIGKCLLQSTYITCNSKAMEISPNQDAGLTRLLFTEDSLKIKKACN